MVLQQLNAANVFLLSCALASILITMEFNKLRRVPHMEKEQLELSVVRLCTLVGQWTSATLWQSLALCVHGMAWHSRRWVRKPIGQFGIGVSRWPRSISVYLKQSSVVVRSVAIEGHSVTGYFRHTSLLSFPASLAEIGPACLATAIFTKVCSASSLMLVRFGKASWMWWLDLYFHCSLNNLISSFWR